MIDKKINKLRNLIKLNNIDGYIVPKNDEFFSEYAFPNRLKTISNFSGSAGLAIILKDKNFLFVDGRYTLQSKIESGNNFKITEIPKLLPHDLLRKYKKELFLGFDPKLFTNNSLKRSFKDSCNLFPINQNLIDLIDTKKIYDHRKEPFYILDDKVVGESVNSKINKFNRKEMLFIKYTHPKNIVDFEITPLVRDRLVGDTADDKNLPTEVTQVEVDDEGSAIPELPIEFTENTSHMFEEE